jgi:hypothetical protein
VLSAASRFLGTTAPASKTASARLIPPPEVRQA